MTRVLVFGSFDLIHPGHHYLFKEAKKLGKELFVVVARDSTIKKIKGKNQWYDENERLKHVQNIKYVDKAVLGNKGDKFKVIEEIKPDIIALGYDQKSFTDELENEMIKRKIKVKIFRISPYKPEIYKSSLLKKKTNYHKLHQ